MKKKAAIIVANYNKSSILDACLTALRQSKNRKDFDCIVIDNGSTDNVAAVEKKHRWAIWIKNKKNLYVSKALNQGFEKCRVDQNYRYVILIANDVLVDRNTCTQLIDFLELNPTIGLTAPIYYEFDTKKVRTAGLGINHWTSLLKNYLPSDHIKANHFVSCYALRSNVFKQVGLYNNVLFPMIYEEPDLGNRIIKLGLTIQPCLKAKIWHPIHLGKKPGFRNKEQQLNDERMINNHAKAYLFFRNRIIYISLYASNLQFICFYFFINPIISLYYLLKMSPKQYASALKGLIHGTRFALNKSEIYIKQVNANVLHI